MGSSGSNRADIFEIYGRYCDIMSAGDQRNSKEAQHFLSQVLESRANLRDRLLEDLLNLMPHINLSVDSHQFTCFYDFVFFLCREVGQKNIPVRKAIMAWRLILTGRFRLLNYWCDFVEVVRLFIHLDLPAQKIKEESKWAQKHQRHNISLDTWQQLLGFSRCVNEDLEGYDPQGAWPVLIDDFVEHMYRISCCGGDTTEDQLNISSSFSGLNLLPGSKRKCMGGIGKGEEMRQSPPASNLKRPRLTVLPDNPLNSTENGAAASTCAVEDSLLKVFDGHLSMGSCFPFGPPSGVSFS